MAISRPDRRRVLAGALGTVVAPALAQAQVAALPGAPAINRNLPDVVVVGAGAFGGWTALNLRERGARVTMVDAYGPGNPHASSGGESRNIQAGYGGHEIYARWGVKAWEAWHQRQAEFGRRLIYPRGNLKCRPKATLQANAATFDRLKLPYEMLDAREVLRRWPQLRYEDGETIFYEKDAGVVKARDSMIAVSEVFMQKGGQVKLGYATPGAAAKGRLNTVTVDGETLSGGAFVFACGPWLPRLMPELLGDRIRTPRRELFFIGPARSDQRYRWENCPTLSDSTVYTSTDIGGGYKIAPTLLNVPMNPDDGDRLPTHFLLQQVEAYTARRLPGLVGRPILASYVCQLERTDNDDYMIDRHPDYANAWIAGGGSGHAFMMGPVLGPHVADLVLGRPQDPQVQAIFGLAAHGPVGEGRGG